MTGNTVSKELEGPLPLSRANTIYGEIVRSALPQSRLETLHSFILMRIPTHKRSLAAPCASCEDVEPSPQEYALTAAASNLCTHTLSSRIVLKKSLTGEGASVASHAGRARFSCVSVKPLCGLNGANAAKCGGGASRIGRRKPPLGRKITFIQAFQNTAQQFRPIHRPA